MEFIPTYRLECENFRVELIEDHVNGQVGLTLDGIEHRFTHDEFVALCDMKYRLRWEPAKAIEVKP